VLIKNLTFITKHSHPAWIAVALKWQMAFPIFAALNDITYLKGIHNYQAIREEESVHQNKAD